MRALITSAISLMDDQSRAAVRRVRMMMFPQLILISYRSPETKHNHTHVIQWIPLICSSLSGREIPHDVLSRDALLRPLALAPCDVTEAAAALELEETRERARQATLHNDFH